MATLKLDDEDHVEGVRERREDAERDQRSEHGAGAVEGAVHPERRGQPIPTAAQRDQNVARHGTGALGRPVERHHARR